MSFVNRLVHYFLPHPSNNHKARFLYPSPIVTFAGAFVLLQLLLSRPQIGPAILGYASNISVNTVIDLTNQKRVAAGANTLRVDPDLTGAANAKAADMFANNYWAHVSPTGVEPWFFFTQANYHYLLAGENLARDFNDSAAVVEAWMNSPSHRENLLNPKYQDIGVAVVNGNLAGTETTLVVQLFGTRLSAPPQIDQANHLAPPVQAQTAPSPTTVLIPTLTPTPAAAAVSQITPALPALLPITPTVLVSPFTLTRGFASFILVFLIVLFILDAIIIWRRQIARLSSDSAAHIAFLLAITAAIWLIKAGVIL